MDVINNLNKSETLLVVCNDEEISKYSDAVKQFSKFKVSTIESLKDVEMNSITNAVLFVEPTPKTLKELLAVLQPEGKLIINNLSDASQVEFNLKTNGFMNVLKDEVGITASKPKFAVGSSAKLNLKKPTVWKLDDGDDDDLIDPDDLLDDDDLKKPDPTSLRVCGTTGVRKACKDCSCGLAEELSQEVKTGKLVDTTDAPKSSCGSCYLGDAFRCASCPYLGMPAFKPGEKIQLSTSQLKSDI
ncbi:unnamed protein product [Ceutorhynchus assimilis]|uniref:Anamorsin homolog n=1 Tax=Ceutorhynchus assimilis TaxID=467358 RepID=A0A9N9MFZ0_9CUCU|nr:unnamed protein product [Ceutorhynchus assimilis]